MTMELVSYEYAKENGLTRYFTGKPCKHGHVSEWIVLGKACVECVKLAKKKWYSKNREHAICMAKQWRTKNPELAKKTVNGWREKNRVRYGAYMAKASIERYVAKSQREPSWSNKRLVDSYYNVCSFFNEINGYAKYHVDHVIPLRGNNVSGLHVHNNLQIITASENKAKSNKFQP